MLVISEADDDQDVVKITAQPSFSLPALFQCNHPTSWTFLHGIERDLQMQRAAFLQRIAGAQPYHSKPYKELKVRVQNTVK